MHSVHVLCRAALGHIFLQAAQLVSLAEGLCPFPSSSSSSNRQLEAVVHQHLPIFHTEHCVFCRCAKILGLLEVCSRRPSHDKHLVGNSWQITWQ